jgi:hypothetical protein
MSYMRVGRDYLGERCVVSPSSGSMVCSTPGRYLNEQDNHAEIKDRYRTAKADVISRIKDKQDSHAEIKERYRAAKADIISRRITVDSDTAEISGVTHGTNITIHANNVNFVSLMEKVRNFVRSFLTPDDSPVEVDPAVIADHGISTTGVRSLSTIPEENLIWRSFPKNSEDEELTVAIALSSQFRAIYGDSEGIDNEDREDSEGNDNDEDELPSIDDDLVEKDIELDSVLSASTIQSTLETEELNAAIELSKKQFLLEYGSSSSEEVVVSKSSSTSSGGVSIGSECVVCMDENRCVMFKPCGHVCCCEGCSSSILNASSPKCPLCRQDLKSRSKTKVFV